MSAHSLFSASAGDGWINCAGRLVLEQGKPRSSSTYADEGTAAHFLASESLEHGEHPSAHLGRTIAVGNDGASWGDTGFTVDADMARFVAKYTEDVRAQVELLGATLLVEQRLNYSSALCVGEDEAFGTGDAILLTDSEIIVADLKYGRGERVEAEDNVQLKLYALGALTTFGDFGDFKTVRVQIHQPRAGGKSEDVFSVDELHAFAARARSAAASVKNAFAIKRDAVWEDTFLHPGEAQCRWCKAKAECPKARGYATELAFDIAPATPDEFAEAVPLPVGDVGDTGWLAAAYARCDMLEGWIKAVRDEVERRVRAGVPVATAKLVQGRKGNAAWVDLAAAEVLLRKTFRLKAEEAYTQRLISPTQAREMFSDQPKRLAKIDELVGRADAGLVLVPATDKRPAVTVQPVAEEFDAVDDPSNFA